MRMTRFIALAALLALPACTTGGVNSASAARTCSTIATASNTVEQIAQFFIDAGIEPAKAAKVAAAVHAFQMTASVACALIPSAPQ